mgnify:FL=1
MNECYYVKASGGGDGEGREDGKEDWGNEEGWEDVG